jgi:hypothetical protein
MEFKNTESQIEGIKEIFAEAKREDNWDTDEPMLYSYYFVDKDADKLDSLGIALEEKDFDFIGVYELGDEETDESTGEYLLHIDKVEAHTPESLAQRNVEFQKLADEYGIVTYDGWEFGEEGVYDEEEFPDEIETDK